MHPVPEIDIERLAALARLRLSDEEKTEFSQQLSQILGFFQQLQSIEVGEIAPMSHPFETDAPLREDDPSPGWSPQRALLNAPASRDNQLVVPKVIEDA
jgi:aspartyl-tRNA(Asn)/glutamyl-tRNA(Gln) amidotransferase subunit C